MVAYDDNEHLFALKNIDKDALDSRGPDFMDREVHIMGALKHPKMVPILFTCSNESEVYISIPRARFANVKTLLHTNDCWLEEALVAKIVMAAVIGLAYMHDNSVIHRDIKPDNLIISKWNPNLVVQICDFGEGKRQGTGEHEGS